MKKTAWIVPSVACLSLAWALPARAQSSVTLYGVIDAGFNYTTNTQTGRNGHGLTGASQFAMEDGATGAISGSRWGLRLNEDLGNGMAAIATLENGFSYQTGQLGQGGDEFGRQAFLGMKTREGTITLGRQYDSVVDYVQPFLSAAQWGGYIADHPGDLDNLDNTHRANNSIKYASPDIDGLKFGGLYSLGGVAGATGRNQIFSLGASYYRGPLSLAVAYLNARNPNYSFFGSNPGTGTLPTSNNMGSLGSATSSESNPVFGGYASASTYQVVAAGAAYQIGASTVGFNYTNTQFRGLGSNDGANPFGYAGIGNLNDVEVNYKYQFTPTLMAGVEYNYLRSVGASGRVDADYNLFAIGTDYMLSKRTDVYLVGVYEHASGTDSFGQPAVAAITGQNPSASDQQYGVRLSFRHRF
ncbi:porin [Burkholderia sp. WAC0059]|uniref:porin n=1 Tax=Burkholderia sp. WAC0059 TaxID=2066022 RepID=UPI000C7EB807|nr:porin [Burkholderia sp. WAC0059]PLZ02381.1 porin [Burkholderia sp. WAC0059]